MRKTLVIAVFLGLISYATAADLSLKNKLKNLAQAKDASHDDDDGGDLASGEDDGHELGDLSGDLLTWCDCEFG